MLSEGESHESAGLGYKHQVNGGYDRQQGFGAGQNCPPPF